MLLTTIALNRGARRSPNPLAFFALAGKMNVVTDLEKNKYAISVVIKR
jgi:hypothetical protein